MVDSETIRPRQTMARSSSLVTTLSRVGEQKFQKIEDLRLKLDATLSSAQLALVDVECEIVENVNHFNRCLTELRPAIRASLFRDDFIPICRFATYLSEPRDENQCAVKPLSRPTQSATDVMPPLSGEFSGRGQCDFKVSIWVASRADRRILAGRTQHDGDGAISASSGVFTYQSGLYLR
jgi:hypothetical protein